MRPEPYAVRLMLAIQHGFNPLHVYCRLVDWRMNRRISRAVIRIYEWCLYRWVEAFTAMIVKIIRKLEGRNDVTQNTS